MTDDTALIRACAEIVFERVQDAFFPDRSHLLEMPPGWNPLTEEHASAQVVERMVELGWAYTIDAVPWMSSQQPGVRVMFAKGVHSPLMLMRLRGDEFECPQATNPDWKRAIAEAAVLAMEKTDEA